MPPEYAGSQPYTLQMMDGSDIAVFHWIGTMDNDDRHRVIPRIVQFCQDHQVDKLIVDGRDQQSGTSIVEAFDFASKVPAELRGIRVAVIHREDDVELQLMETVASNRGLLTRPFLKFDHARAWLESLDPSNRIPG